MNKNVEKLEKLMNLYANKAKNGAAYEELIPVSEDLVFAMNEVLKDETVKLFIPVKDDRPQIVIEDWNGGKIFLPMYTDEKLITDMDYVEMKPWDTFRCAEESKGVSGVIINPNCDNVFAFEDHLFTAVISRYLGVTSFTYFDTDGNQRKMW